MNAEWWSNRKGHRGNLPKLKYCRVTLSFARRAWAPATALASAVVMPSGSKSATKWPRDYGLFVCRLVGRRLRCRHETYGWKLVVVVFVVDWFRFVRLWLCGCSIWGEGWGKRIGGRFFIRTDIANTRIQVIPNLIGVLCVWVCVVSTRYVIWHRVTESILPPSHCSAFPQTFRCKMGVDFRVRFMIQFRIMRKTNFIFFCPANTRRIDEVSSQTETKH